MTAPKTLYVLEASVEIQDAIEAWDDIKELEPEEEGDDVVVYEYVLKAKWELVATTTTKVTKKQIK